MSANCEYYQELMSRMLDGDLLKAETDALREHIRTCRECRMLCAAFSSMTLSLREDDAEPPVSLAGSVMGRIRSYEAELALELDDTTAEKPIPLRSPARRSHAKKKHTAWRSTLVAACLVLVIGVGTVAALTGRGKTTETLTADSAAGTYSREAAPAAPEPEKAANGEAMAGVYGEAPAQEEGLAAATDHASDVGDAAAAGAAMMAEEAPEEETAAEPAEAPAPAVAEASIQAAAEETAADDAAAAVGYDLANPAYVPEGSEDAFKALLTDAGWMPEASFHAFYAVEHNGIIYEFMTDENEEYLLWRDAAEGFPTLSESSFDDLWAIFK